MNHQPLNVIRVTIDSYAWLYADRKPEIIIENNGQEQINVIVSIDCATFQEISDNNQKENQNEKTTP